MRKNSYKLSETDITLLLNIISNSELFYGAVEDCKKHFGMSQKLAIQKSKFIMDKLVRQREVLISKPEQVTI